MHKALLGEALYQFWRVINNLHLYFLLLCAVDKPSSDLSDCCNCPGINMWLRALTNCPVYVCSP